MERHVARMGKLKMTRGFCGKMRTKGVIAKCKYRKVGDIKSGIKWKGQLGVPKSYVR